MRNASDRKDDDRLDRYPLRHVWLADRPHRGFAGNRDMAAFGDESLYHPARLGRAAVSPATVHANETAPLHLSYTAGPDGLAESTQVTFVIRGQSPLGNFFPGFTVHAPNGQNIEALEMGFRLKQGCLAAGETIALTAPPFRWTPLAGRIEFNVVIDRGDGTPQRRLPEPLTVDVLPGPATHVELTVPCTHTAGELPFSATIRDASDNRVPSDDRLQIETDRGSASFAMRDGIARATITIGNKSGATRLRARTQATGFEVSSNPSLHAKPPAYYIGDLHCHDFMSEAAGYTDAVYRWAIDDRGLDFVSVVPQAHGWLDNQTWTVAKYMNERYLNEGKFVTLLGFEWQHTGYGDKVVHYLGGDQPYLPVDDPRYNSAAKLYAALRESDALTISHHPCYPAGSWCSSTDFTTVETDVDRLVELWSMHGSAEGWDATDRPLRDADPERQVMPALRRGVRMGFTAGSDTHSGRPGGSAKEPRPHWGGLTGIWAETLTRRSLFNALYNRHTCALTGARIILKFTVNGALMGSELPASDTARLCVDVWAPAPIARVELIKNTRRLQTFTPDSDTCRVELDDETGGPAFYHCRVTQSDGHLAVCSPVWLG